MWYVNNLNCLPSVKFDLNDCKSHCRCLSRCNAQDQCPLPGISSKRYWIQCLHIIWADPLKHGYWVTIGPVFHAPQIEKLLMPWPDITEVPDLCCHLLFYLYSLPRNSNHERRSMWRTCLVTSLCHDSHSCPHLENFAHSYLTCLSASIKVGQSFSNHVMPYDHLELFRTVTLISLHWHAKLIIVIVRV